MPWNVLFKRRQIIAFGVFVLAITAIALLYSSAVYPKQHSLLTVWTSTEHDVEVRIDVQKYPSGQLRLQGTFTPTRQGFYLYSKDLPKDGLNGLGRPTLLEVAPSESIKPTGPLEANQPLQDIYVPVLGISFPVYPPGPVTLSLPVEFTGKDKWISAEISITYMACSDKTCLPPVINKHIIIQVPASFFEE